MTLKQQTIYDVRAVRQSVGVWRRDDHGFIRLSGPDTAQWLQSQTTNDVLALESGQGHSNALLDRRGRLQAHFTLHRWEDEFWMLVQKAQIPALLERLDSHLFIEDVQIEDASDDVAQFTLQGPRTLGSLSTLMDTAERDATDLLPRDEFHCHPVELLGHDVLAFRISDSGEDGYVFVTEPGEAAPLMEDIRRRGNFDIAEVSPEAREVLRIEAGIPKFGVDMDASNVISETTLERDAVSFEKGCYLGQEVVARLRTYGSAKQALMGLVFEPGTELPPFDTEIFEDGKRIGRIKSAVDSPTLEAPIALAYLDRDHRMPNERITFTGPKSKKRWNVRVVVLPIYAAPSSEERAQKLYEDALECFQKDLKDEDESAIPLLKEAILLNPTFEDAYEVLGVILNRHHRVDEAIYYMQKLVALNPDCMMAHTNLSVFYVAKGMIEEAENEKAQAAVLGMKQQSDARRAEEIAQQERERIQQEARDRIRMFEEVLEIDPEDPIATFGMGSAYIQLNEYANAIPYLERATQVQKDYSAAYLNLGKCHEFLKHTEEAIAAYREGIAVAARKGDLMPMREMERRLKSLEEGAPTETATGASP